VPRFGSVLSFDAPEVEGPSPGRALYVPRGFWRDWTAAIHARYPSFKTVGEVYDSDPALTSFFQGGRAPFDGIDSGLDSVFDFPLQDAIARVFTGKARCASCQRCWHTTPSTPMRRAWSR